MKIDVVYVVTETLGGEADVVGAYVARQQALEAAAVRLVQAHGWSTDGYESLDDALQAFNEWQANEDRPFIDVHPTVLHG
jgi:hypothetical protein